MIPYLHNAIFKVNNVLDHAIAAIQTSSQSKTPEIGSHGDVTSPLRAMSCRVMV